MAKQLLNLQNKVAQLEKKKNERDLDNCCNAEVMDTGSADLSSKSDFSSCGSKGKTNYNLNTDSTTYVIITSINKNAKSKRLDAITETVPSLSSVTDDGNDKLIYEIKILNERNQKKKHFVQYII